MKQWFVALMLLALGLAAPIPAQAQSMEACSHDPTISSLRDCVQHAAQVGHIDNSGVAYSLIIKLGTAQLALERGQSGAAINLLEAFVSQVRAQAGKHIHQEHANHMLMHAQEVIQALLR